MKVSQLITHETIQTWNTGDIITIKAGTGAGKSYFIKNTLYNYAKENEQKILFLIHRTNCVNQFQKEIEADHKTDIIHIKTYQHIEALYKNNKTFDFWDYSYIVCDEFHYFMSDAAFNKTTDMSLNAILKQELQIKIFMSATGDHMQNYISNYKKLPTIDYNLLIDYRYINSLTFFNKDDTMEQFIKDAIRTNEKGIFFIQSAKKAYELYKKYKKYCLFNCSKSNKEYYKYVNVNKINDMLVNEKFNELILITTTCFDSGVNIKDPSLKHIVCDVKDIPTIIQCLGRKRLQTKDDYINVYIKSVNNKSLGGSKKHIKNKLEQAIFLKSHTVKEYIEKYQREPDYKSIVYDDTTEDDNKGTKKINMLMYFKCIIDIANIDMYLQYGNYGWCKFISHLFGKEKEYRLLEEDYKMNTIKNYLENAVGKKLRKDEQKELIHVIELKDKYGRLQKGINILNAYLIDNKLNYMIISKRSSTIVEGKKKDYRYWEIISNIDNK